MILPTNYCNLTPIQRREVRLEYIKLQNGKCYHCKADLNGPPTPKIMGMEINKKLFPKTFFVYPIHLHHDHKTGNTLGAVHCHCNAVLWQYYGE